LSGIGVQDIPRKIKAKLKSLYIKVVAGFPVLGRVIHRVYFRITSNAARKNVYGKQNAIHYDNCILSSVLFDIKGNTNNIEIKNGCFLQGVTFYIRGDDHNITIGERCRLGQGSII